MVTIWERGERKRTLAMYRENLFQEHRLGAGRASLLGHPGVTATSLKARQHRPKQVDIGRPKNIPFWLPALTLEGDILILIGGVVYPTCDCGCLC